MAGNLGQGKKNTHIIDMDEQRTQSMEECKYTLSRFMDKDN